MTETWYCSKCGNPLDPAVVIISADSAGRTKLAYCPICRTKATPRTAAVQQLPPRAKRKRRTQADPDDLWLPDTSFAAKLPGSY